MGELLSRTQGAAAKGEYELFKTSSVFDTTAKHPDFLGGHTTRVRELMPPGSG